MHATFTQSILPTVPCRSAAYCGIRTRWLHSHMGKDMPSKAHAGERTIAARNR